jgi:hypothetical protein
MGICTINIDQKKKGTVVWRQSGIPPSILNLGTSIHKTDRQIDRQTDCLSPHPPTYLWLYSSCGPWPLFQFLNLYTLSRTPWTDYQPVARPLPWHRTTQTQNKRTQISMPWVGFDPIRSQCSSEWRYFMPQTARPLWSVDKTDYGVHILF